MPCILIVDDDPAARYALHIILEGDGFDTRTAADGEAAVEEFTSPERPAFVLLDARMPKVDGMQVLDWLAQRPELDGIPVVLVSGDPRVVPHPRAVAILRKPYELGDLLQLARRFCVVK